MFGSGCGLMGVGKKAKKLSVQNLKIYRILFKRRKKVLIFLALSGTFAFCLSLAPSLTANGWWALVHSVHYIIAISFFMFSCRFPLIT